jgi:hypothetical protein
VIAHNVIFGDTCRIGITSSSASAVQIGNVSSVICNAQLANDSGSSATTRGIQTSAAVSKLTFGGSTTAGDTAFSNDIDSSGFAISNSTFSGVKFGSVYLQGSNNTFIASPITSLTLKDSASTGNSFLSPVDAITLVSSATIAAQSFGKIYNVALTGAAISNGANTVTLGSTTASTVGAAGGASALPATPLGYLIGYVGATQVKIPYYSV